MPKARTDAALVAHLRAELQRRGSAHAHTRTLGVSVDAWRRAARRAARELGVPVRTELVSGAVRAVVTATGEPPPPASVPPDPAES